MRQLTITRIVLGTVFIAAASAPAMAGSHLWRFNEIFSNADGTIQFVELKECCGAANEIGLNGKWVRSALTGNQFTFPGNLPCSNCTSNKHLLLATQAFADLPGAPTPDYIIPENFLCTRAAGNELLTYWTYAAANWTLDPATIPLDGVNSLAGDGTIAPNSPKNFDEQTASISVPAGNPADINGDGEVGVDDLTEIILGWGANDCAAADIDRNGVIDVDDLTLLILNWGI